MSEFNKECPSEHPSKNIQFIRTLLRVLPAVRHEEKFPGHQVSYIFTSPSPEAKGNFTIDAAISCARTIFRGECAKFEYIEDPQGESLNFELKDRTPQPNLKIVK